MKVCFIGIGSIARRHIRNLKNICVEREIDLSIDAFRRNHESVDGVDQVHTDIEKVPDDYDMIFITNPTELHLDTLKKFHMKGRSFFIEKPVVSLNQIEHAKKFSLKRDSVYYVACPLRYSAVIRYIKDNIDPESVISVRSISSSYLPDWRPGQDYRVTYSAHKKMGGGVSLDLIHEWDYLTYLFGWPERVNCLIGKKSSLEIDSDDYAIYIGEYVNKIVELHLDYFGRKTIREVQLITIEDTIIGDIVNNTIIYLKRGKKINFNEKRDNYQCRELNHFIDMTQGLVPLEDGYHHGIAVLDLAQGKMRVENML